MRDPVLRSSLWLTALISVVVAASTPACSADPNGSSPGGGSTVLDASSNDGSAGDGSAGDGSASDGGAPLPFYADAPNVYVAKIKNVLVGLPPTDAEVSAVTADPTQLGKLVDGWMDLPQYQSKMLRFFELAFQQTQIAFPDFDFTIGEQANPGQPLVQPGMMQNQQEMFARTALSLIAGNQPFTQILSTQTYTMTTAMKMFYAFTDVWQQQQGMPNIDALSHSAASITVTDVGPIPLSETLDPTSPNFMHWYNAQTFNSGCHTVVYGPPYGFGSLTLLQIVFGKFNQTTTPRVCGSWSGDAQFNAQTDFADWSTVTVRQPNAGEATTQFYDLPTLRSATSLVLNRPAVGYFTTPAFFANWQTNDSNQMRVTMNQSFIVATNAQVDGTDTTVPSSTPGLDSSHAFGACITCHQLLDPSRSILAANFGWYYASPQQEPTFKSQPGLFAFEGVVQPVKSVNELAKILATHPLVASGWAQKLCYYVNSERCEPSDPEFQKIVTLFQSSNYSWTALVKALVTSPITTHVRSTLTATTDGETVAVSRRDHLCAALNARIGIADVCGLNAMQAPVLTYGNGYALAVVNGLPSDGYGRGNVVPQLPNRPSIFYRTGLENLCEGISSLVIDHNNPPAGQKVWSSAQPAAAIADFVTLVAGLAPSDPRAAPLGQALQAHFTAVEGQPGGTPTVALQSTFIAACLAPTADGIGL